MLPTKSGFLNFARNQSGSYDYYHEESCAIGQYIKSLGHSGKTYGGTFSYVMNDGSTFNFKKEMPWVVQALMLSDNTWEDLVKILEN